MPSAPGPIPTRYGAVVCLLAMLLSALSDVLSRWRSGAACHQYSFEHCRIMYARNWRA